MLGPRAMTNPILLIHDVGAGGLSNAIPESIAHSERGGRIDLREQFFRSEPGMSPLEIWCNEAQERYVLIIAPSSTLARFARGVRARGGVRSPWSATIDRRWTARGRRSVVASAAPVDVPLRGDPRQTAPHDAARYVSREPGLSATISPPTAHRCAPTPRIDCCAFLRLRTRPSSSAIGDRSSGRHDQPGSRAWDPGRFQSAMSR